MLCLSWQQAEDSDILGATPICAQGNPYPLNKHNAETLAKVGIITISIAAESATVEFRHPRETKLIIRV